MIQTTKGPMSGKLMTAILKFPGPYHTQENSTRNEGLGLSRGLGKIKCIHHLYGSVGDIQVMNKGVDHKLWYQDQSSHGDIPVMNICTSYH